MLLRNMLMAKFEIVFIYILTFLKSEIHHYLVNLFKVSGRSIEEISIGVLAYFFDSFWIV